MGSKKTGIEFIGQTDNIYKYIDHNNKTVIYKINDFNRGVAICCAPLYEDKIKTEQQIPPSSTDRISTDKPKFGYLSYL